MFPERYTDVNKLLKPHGENKVLFSTIYHYLLHEKEETGNRELYLLRQVASNYVHKLEIAKPFHGGYTAEYVWENEYNTEKPLKEPWSHDNHTALLSLAVLYNLEVTRFPLRASHLSHDNCFPE